jgi:hypothetical protein
MQNLSPFFEKLLEARAQQERDASKKSANGALAAAPKWAFNLEWLSLDFTDMGR